MRSISAPFIRRPIGTTLASIGLFLAGTLAFFSLPIASVPAVEYPTIHVYAARPGADPVTMAATVTAPLERAISAIAGVNELTSQTSIGTAYITVQFDLSRSIDKAGSDVQAALNAAVVDLPGDLPSLPRFSKANPAAAPVFLFALTSNNLSPDALYDAADSVIAQRLAQVPGVAQVSVNGAEQPAIRARIDPARLAAMGIGLDQVRAAIANANVSAPVGALEGNRRSESIATNDQIETPRDYGSIVVRAQNGAAVPLSAVADVERGTRSTRVAGWYDHKPAVLISISKQPDANIIDTVDGVKALLPELQRWIPAGIDFHVVQDRTIAIRSSIAEVERALILSIVLVMAVVFVFLRGRTAVLAAAVTVPLSLAGTFAAMWAAHFTIDNLSLMAITISVGFVVDDAIVMIENIHRNIEKGMSRRQAAIDGARQIGFTVVAISVSLVAAFIPVLFMGGIMGRLFREFSLTLTFAIAISTLVSLTVTPMICAHFLGRFELDRPNVFYRAMDVGLAKVLNLYGRSLRVALRYPSVLLAVLLATVVLTVELYQTIPKGWFPEDQAGLLFASTNADADISFPAMEKLQQQVTAIIAADPGVESAASFVGSSWSVNTGRLYITVKPVEAGGEDAGLVMKRLRDEVVAVRGLQTYIWPIQDLRTGAREGKSRYQFTLWDSDFDELDSWQQKVLDRLRGVSQLIDVSTDRDDGGLLATVTVDRRLASRFGVPMQNIDAVIGDAFGQKQISTIFTDRNQYAVIVDVPRWRRRDPSDLSNLFVAGTNGTQVPLASIARVERGPETLTINHQGQFPSVTFTYNTADGVSIDEADNALRSAVAELHLPDTLHADFAGDAKAFSQDSDGQGLLILAALLAVYIILGILYESLVHPLTIISTLPSAGLGALLALKVCDVDLSLVALIGIILLIGLVKKNGIMLVDFAIAAERGRGAAPAAAIYEACLARFRPILMTTLAALFGAVPLAIATGAGAEIRRPLGITIVGGLVLSQFLTLYTTPAIYVLMSRLRGRRERVSSLQKLALHVPAE